MASKLELIIQYITDVYKLKVTPCSIPRSDFQYFKRSIYLLFLAPFPRIFYFLLKISPIKFLKERPDGSIWFESGSVVNGDKIEVSISLHNNSYYINSYTEYVLRLSLDADIQDIYNNIDIYLSKNKILKSRLREYKLSKLI